MSKGQKSIQKVKRKERKVREHAKGYAKVPKTAENLKETPRAYQLMRKAERRMDRTFGNEVTGQKPPLEYKAVSTTIDRFDYDPGAGTDFGIRMTMPAAIRTAAGLQPGDWVEIREELSALHGRMLQVVALTDSTHTRLDDVPSYVGPESNDAVRMLISTVKKASY